MANWYGSSRSNYFKVKDEAAFRKWAEERGLTVITGKARRFGVYPGDFSEDGGWPSFVYDEEKDDNVEVDIAYEISQHLADGEVAVIQSIGAEKLRYLTGWAEAINHKGERVSVSIDDIYEKAREAFGVKPALATY